MAVLLGNTIWEGKSEAEEPRPTYEQGARDGHLYSGILVAWLATRDYNP